MLCFRFRKLHFINNPSVSFLDSAPELLLDWHGDSAPAQTALDQKDKKKIW
jgi:hypothetical protein